MKRDSFVLPFIFNAMKNKKRAFPLIITSFPFFKFLLFLLLLMFTTGREQL